MKNENYLTGKELERYEIIIHNYQDQKKFTSSEIEYLEKIEDRLKNSKIRGNNNPRVRNKRKDLIEKLSDISVNRLKEVLRERLNQRGVKRLIVIGYGEDFHEFYKNHPNFKRRID